MKNKGFLFCLLLSLSTGHVFAQDTAIYDCNVRLLTKRPHCDSLRYTKVHPKVNYKKMLRKDKKLLLFLNQFHSGTLSLNNLQLNLERLITYNVYTKNFSDTSFWRGTITNKGLVKLVVKFWHKDGQILKRYYDLEINNPSDAAFSRPLDYHYDVFKLLDFCLGKRYSCYNFEDEF